jgi:hypothetical protein
MAALWCDSGYDIESPGAIYDWRAIRCGLQSDLLALSKLTPDQQQKVFSAFDELGPDMLRPVHEKLNASVNYDELKILRLCYLCEKEIV